MEEADLETLDIAVNGRTIKGSIHCIRASLGEPMKFATLRSSLVSVRSFIQETKVPIIPELLTASWSNWRESFKEAFVTLFFSLMPLWLGLFIIRLLTIADGTSGFLAKFASSSDLGILSASLLGPMLYMMFREDEASDQRIVPRFPSGLWFIMFTVACCIVATVIYCFNYVSGLKKYFDESGLIISFVKPDTVAFVSWSLFCLVVLLIICASTIRNSMETRSPGMMSADTQDYVSQLQAAQGDQQDFVNQLQAAQGANDAAPT